MPVEEKKTFIRHNIAPLARALRIGGVPIVEVDIDPLNRHYEPGSAEAIAVWNQHKTERNALIAVVVNRLINRAITDGNRYPPFGLVRKRFGYRRIAELKPNKYVYSVLDEAMSDTLRRALDIEMREIEKLAGVRTGILGFVDRVLHRAPQSTSDPIVGVGRRLNKIVTFGNIYLPDYFKKNTSSTSFFIRRGISTASETMTGLLRVIPNVYEREFPDQLPDPNLLAEIARNSYPLVVDSAAQHVHTLTRARERLGRSWFPPFSSYNYSYDPANFEIRSAANGLHLVIKQDVKKMIDTSFGVPPGDLQDSIETTGCPALVSFDGSSPVRKLWDWYTEIAETVYGGLYALPQERRSTRPIWSLRPAGTDFGTTRN